MVVATGTVALVICGAATDLNFSLLALKGAAEGAAEVCDCEPSLFSIGSARSPGGAGFAPGGSVPASAGRPT
jgi:hypothetical protein